MRIDRIKGDDIHVQVLRSRIYREENLHLKSMFLGKIKFFC